MNTYHSNYLRDVFANKSRMKKTIKKCRDALKGVDYDAIVVTGVSGLAIGATLAYLTGKSLVVVRKDSEKSHADQKVEGMPATNFKYVIVDDFVSSGDTLIAIAEKMDSRQKMTGVKNKFVGLIQYHCDRQTFCDRDNMEEKAFFCAPSSRREKFRELIG